MSRNRGEGDGRRVSFPEARRLRRKVTLDFCLIYVQFLYFVQDFMLPGSFLLVGRIWRWDNCPEFLQPPKGPSLCAEQISLN